MNRLASLALPDLSPSSRTPESRNRGLRPEGLRLSSLFLLILSRSSPVLLPWSHFTHSHRGRYIRFADRDAVAESGVMMDLFHGDAEMDILLACLAEADRVVRGRV